MAEIVNLRQARKRKARLQHDREAEQNRLLHGRSKSEKAGTAAESASLESFLDGHRLKRPQERDDTT